VHLFNDPNKWVASIVSSWYRFWFFAMALIGFLVYTVDSAVSSGWHAVWGAVFFLGAFQLMFLYALKQLHRRPPSEELQRNNAV